MIIPEDLGSKSTSGYPGSLKDSSRWWLRTHPKWQRCLHHPGGTAEFGKAGREEQKEGLQAARTELSLLLVTPCLPKQRNKNSLEVPYASVGGGGSILKLQTWAKTHPNDLPVFTKNEPSYNKP